MLHLFSARDHSPSSCSNTRLELLEVLRLWVGNVAAATESGALPVALSVSLHVHVTHNRKKLAR